MRNISYLIAMVITGVITLIMFFSLISNKKQKSQIKTFFLACLFTIFIWIFSLCSQIIFQNSSVSPILFEGFASFGACFIPIAILFLGLTFTRTKIKFKLSYLLLFIIPINVWATTFDLKDTDMSITIDEDIWYVFTPDNILNNPGRKK